MRKFELIAPCHFGLESVLKKEILDLGYEIKAVDDGRVSFLADSDGIVRANMNLRTAERVMINAATFKATTFDELFEGVKAVKWEEYLPKNAKFWVTKASSVKSKLFSPSDIQSIVKRAMVARLSEYYGIKWFPEDGASYPLRVFIKKDIVTLGIDTTGESLHKRGYRKLVSKAPIAENLAAALLMLTPWKADRILIDPFCGSGTIPIEAAMIAANIAPGLEREFTCESWINLIDKKLWYENSEEARDLIDLSVNTDIQGYDIDGQIVAAARENAKRAGVEKLIHLQQREVKNLSHPKKYGFILTNPPYGERLEDKESIRHIYGEFGQAYKNLEDWSAYIISSYENTEGAFGKKADKNRKIYNGMMKTYFYEFRGNRPPKNRNGQ